MDDRELLELAAKAVGRVVGSDEPSDCDPIGRKYCESLGLWCIGPWEGWFNPLGDNGDALSVAAKLRLIIRPGKYLVDGCSVESQRDGIAGCTAFRKDAAEQMRYAIVVVAAEIGKGMKS